MKKRYELLNQVKQQNFKYNKAIELIMPEGAVTREDIKGKGDVR